MELLIGCVNETPNLSGLSLTLARPKLAEPKPGERALIILNE